MLSFSRLSKFLIYIAFLLLIFVIWMAFKPQISDNQQNENTHLQPSNLLTTLSREQDESIGLGHLMLQEKKETEQKLQQLKARCHQLIVGIYSRDFANLFHLSYYCSKIAELQQDWQSDEKNFQRSKKRIAMSLKRLEQLQRALKESQAYLIHDSEQKADYERCLQSCLDLQQNYEQHQAIINQAEAEFKALGETINQLNHYANGDSHDDEQNGQLAQRIADGMLSPSTIYPYFFAGKLSFSQLQEDLEREIKQKLFEPADEDFGRAGLVLFYVIATASVCLLLITKYTKRICTTNRSRAMLTPLRWLSLLLVLYIASPFLPQGFVHLDTMVIMEYVFFVTLFYAALGISFYSIRVERGLALFTPFVVANGFWLAMSSLLLGGTLLELTAPFLFLACAIWMGLKLRKGFLHLRVGLRVISIICIATLFLGCLGSFWGYAYMMMLLSLFCFVCIINFLIIINLRKLARMVFPYILRTRLFQQYGVYPAIWLKLIINYLITPAVFLVMIWYGLLWPADCFDLEHYLLHWMDHNFTFSSIIRVISANRVLSIISLGIALHAAIKIVQFTLTELYKQHKHAGRMLTLFTLGRMVAWAIYVIISLHILHADYNSLLVIMGGMSVGIGIALKDTMDNLVSGLSLIFGRLRPGDIVECNGIRGKVANIGYRTTSIETMDGAILAFQNSQLFNQDFRNLTRNHEFQRNEFIIGIEYGADVKRARDLIMEALGDMRTLSPTQVSKVLLYEFGDSSVNLLVRVWVPAKARTSTLSEARERIYESFNQHGITIPFPQRDLHIIDKTGAE